MLPDPSSTSRPPRPNSIEVKRNYSAYANNEEVYASRHARSPQDNTYRSVIFFYLLVFCIDSVVIVVEYVFCFLSSLTFSLDSLPE